MISYKSRKSYKPKIFLLSKAHSLFAEISKKSYFNSNTPSPDPDNAELLKREESPTKFFFFDEKVKPIHSGVKKKKKKKKFHCDKWLTSHRCSIEKQVVSIFSEGQRDIKNNFSAQTEENASSPQVPKDFSNNFSVQTEEVFTEAIPQKAIRGFTADTLKNVIKKKRNFRPVYVENDLNLPFSISPARINKRNPVLPCNKQYPTQRKTHITLSILSPKDLKILKTQENPTKKRSSTPSYTKLRKFDGESPKKLYSVIPTITIL